MDGKTTSLGKRFLSLFLCIVFCLSLMPTAAFADDTGDNGETEEQVGTISLVDRGSSEVEPQDDPDGDEPFPAEAEAFAADSDAPQENASLEDGFYLIGIKGWTEEKLTAADRFTENPNADGEYLLVTTLTARDEFKAVKVEGGKIAAWYPEGMGNNYFVPDNQAGLVTIYFRPDGSSSWNGHFLVVTAQDAVAQVGNRTFESPQDAVNAANEGDTVKILKANTYTLPGLPKNITVEGAVDGVVFEHTTAGDIASIPNGATFRNVTFNLGNVNYHGFQHNGGLTFENCTFNGKFFTYGTETYTNCTFVQTSSDYNMWVYGGGKTVTYDGCSFESSGKFLNVYNENGALVELIVKNCTFTNTGAANKAALNVKETCTNGTALKFNVTISNCTLQGAFPEASITDALVVGENGLWQVDDRLTNGTETGITVTLDGTVVYPLPKEYVAQIGETKYETLEAAIEAAQDGNTVELLKDVDLGSAFLTLGDKTITLDGAYTITSAAAQAILLLGDKDVTIKANVTATKGHGIQAGNDAAYSGKFTLDRGTLTVAKRGIRVYEEDTGFEIAVNNATIQSNVADPTTTYTTGNDSMALSLGSTDGKGYNVAITNSTLQGFSYNINNVTSGSNLTVTMTGGKTFGRAALNVWGSNNTFTMSGVEVHGLNNQTGSTEAFACVVENKGAANNTYNINNCTFIATLSDAAMNTAGSTASEQMVDLRGTGSAFHISGNTTYTCNSEERGGLLYSEGSIANNTITLDSTAKESMATWLEKLSDDVIQEAIENDGIKLTYAPQVFYYWFVGTEINGQYSHFEEPFLNGWLDIDEHIALQKDVTLTAQVEWTKAGAFYLELGEYTLTLGEGGKITLGEGASVIADKKIPGILSAPEGFNVQETKNENGTFTYSLTPKDYVAQIGTTKYETLEAAFAAAVDGDTITVLKDCSGNGIKAPQGKFTNGLTVDFGGFTYTVDGTTVGSTGTETNGFQLLKDNKITFKGGTITSEKAKILIQNYSDLTLEGMTLSMNNASYTSAYTLSNNNGNVTVKGSTISANPAGGFAFDVCRYSSYPSVHVTVENSSINGDIEISASGNDPKDGSGLTLKGETTVSGALVIAGNLATPIENQQILVVKDNSITLEAPADYKWIDNGSDTVRLTPKDYVAENTNTGAKYETLEEAIAAAEDGQTVKLLKDSSGNGIKAPQGKFTNGLTVDFGGHTYTVDGTTVGSTGTETNGFQLLKDNKITFQNGTITSEKAKILIQNYSDLTLKGMTLEMNNANYTSAYTLSNNNGSVVIEDSTIKANPAGGFAFDVCRFSSYPSVNVTVTGESKIEGDIEVSASGSDAKEGFKLLIEAGVTVKGKLVLDSTAAAAMDAAPDKALIVKENNVALDAPADYKWVEYDDTHVTLGSIYVAKNLQTEKKYTTLNGALADAKTGETVVPLTNITNEAYILVMAGITLDLNGYDVTGATLFYVTGTLVDHGENRGKFSAEAYYLGKSVNSEFPIYDSATDTYSLYHLTVSLLAQNYRFRMSNTDDRPAAMSMILSNEQVMGRVVAAVRLTWQTGEGESAQTNVKTVTFANSKILPFYKAYLPGGPRDRAIEFKFSSIDNTKNLIAVPMFIVYDANGAEMMTLEGDSWHIN